MVKDQMVVDQTVSHKIKTAFQNIVGDQSDQAIPLHNEYKGIQMDNRFDDLVAYGMMGILMLGYFLIPLLGQMIGGFSIFVVMGLFFGYAFGMEIVGKILALEEASSHMYLHATMRFPNEPSTTTQIKISNNLTKVPVNEVRQRDKVAEMGMMQQILKWRQKPVKVKSELDGEEVVKDPVANPITLQMVNPDDVKLIVEGLGEGDQVSVPRQYVMANLKDMSEFWAAGYQNWFYENEDYAVMFILPDEFESALKFRDDNTFVRGQIINARVAKASFMYVGRGQIVLSETLEPAICDIMICTDCDFYANNLFSIMFPSSKDIATAQLALDEFQTYRLAGTLHEFQRRYETALQLLHRYKRNYMSDLARDLADLNDVDAQMQHSGAMEEFSKTDVVIIIGFVLAVSFLLWGMLFG